MTDRPGDDVVVLVASGDLRLSANQTCWPAQAEMEQRLGDAMATFGVRLERAHLYDEDKCHGFIDSQRMGMDVFATIDPDARVVVAEAVWQYSHHVLAGLRRHRGPLLTVANWDGQWPGLVGMLNLNGSLTKAGRGYDTLWSVDFTDEWFLKRLGAWLAGDAVAHDQSHVTTFDPAVAAGERVADGQRLARELVDTQTIMGIFDEGCMGMYNAIIDDEMLNPMGIYKERLSQSALLAAMRGVADEQVVEIRTWLKDEGMTFELGIDPATELTEDQISSQLRMYVAAARIAEDFGCETIGIQYQQGLKDMAPASDLAEGLLNDRQRPPARRRDGTEIRPGQAIPHFNEVDQGVAVDLIVTGRVWKDLGLDPTSTLHDIRWGEHYTGEDVDDFVWVMEISGAVPPSHLDGGYAGAVSKRQPPMYFPLGGGGIWGFSRPGAVVWSRVYVEDGGVNIDIGRATAVRLPESEAMRRSQATTPQWPIMHAVLHGVTRDQLMAKHKANHITVTYAPDEASADRALAVKAAMCAELGMQVNLCGDTALSGTS